MRSAAALHDRIDRVVLAGYPAFDVENFVGQLLDIARELVHAGDRRSGRAEAGAGSIEQQAANIADVSGDVGPCRAGDRPALEEQHRRAVADFEHPSVFRRFVLDHPALFRITFQRAVPGFEPGPELLAARDKGWRRLTAKLQRLEHVGLLQRKPLRQAVIEYQAMCEGLANFEMRGTTMRMLDHGREEQIWRDAFTSLIATFA